MKSKLGAALAGCALALSIGGVLPLTISPANAVLFTPANGTTVDFGNVTVNTTAHLSFSVTWSAEAGETFGQPNNQPAITVGGGAGFPPFNLNLVPGFPAGACFTSG